MSDAHDLYAPVYAFVRTVPRGRVVTYGQVAECVTEVALTARQVGMAMAIAPPDVPWHRVVGAGGYLPIHRRSPLLAQEQHWKLQAEGVTFLPGPVARVDMARCQWHPFFEDEGGGLFREGD
ncbi:MAG: MGMT family protein [Chloroherpetonaceae bacterium]|nr:MGMT family protein [Chthonomonadaceae bacterium]MDW8208152.1 MGMT family protein [Chloroherpetonaceae bacterium]